MSKNKNANVHMLHENTTDTLKVFRLLISALSTVLIRF